MGFVTTHVQAPFATAAFLAAVAVAAACPLLPRSPAPLESAAGTFPGWPPTFEGRALTELPLTSREREFVRDFPGRIARFSDGYREIILRWVTAPTRKLHPASDCFRGIGFAITPLPLRRDFAGKPMGCFRANHGPEQLTVCEMIRDDAGNTWSDVSAWYWTALFNSSRAPWWSVVVAEKS